MWIHRKEVLIKQTVISKHDCFCFLQVCFSVFLVLPTPGCVPATNVYFEFRMLKKAICAIAHCPKEKK